MSKNANYNFDVKQIRPEALSLKSIIENPRDYTPADLQAAADNNEITCREASVEPIVDFLVRYILIDFFIYAHRTGLYNRQRILWESIAHVTNVQVFQNNRGIFKKEQLPYFDFNFMDYKGKVLLALTYVDPFALEKPLNAERLLSKAISRLSSLGKPNGVFYCVSKPFPEKVIEKIKRMTNGNDPVGKYESKLPEPANISIDLIEIDNSNLASNIIEANLAYPDLQPKKKLSAHK